MILTAAPRAFIPDTTIVTMLEENNLSAWEHLYDKYAPIMYGAIFQITGDGTMSEEIFKECFLQLKENNNLLEAKTALCPFLLRHAHSITLKYLKKSGLASVVSGQASFNDDPLIQLLSIEEGNAIDKPESEPNVTQETARKKLREEFNNLRNQHRQKTLF